MTAYTEGAETLARKLRDLGYSCERVGSVVDVEPLGIKVRFEKGQKEGHPKTQKLLYTTATRVRNVPFDITDVAMGIGLPDATIPEAAVEAYLGGVFSLAHALSCDDYEAFGVRRETVYSTEAQSGLPLEWDLYYTPLLQINDAAIEFDASCFVDAAEGLSSVMLSRVGVYWFRCFASKSAGTDAKADCFINNMPCEEGAACFRPLAERFSGSSPLQSIKQQFVLIPRDRELIRKEETDEASENSKGSTFRDCAISASSADVPRDTLEIVMLGLSTFELIGDRGDDEIRSWLTINGCSIATADKLFFLWPHVVSMYVLGDIVRSAAPDHFKRVNSADFHYEIIRFDDEPLFKSITTVFEELLRTNSTPALEAFCYQSPVFNAVNNALNDGADPKDLELVAGVVITEDRLPLEPTEEILMMLAPYFPAANKQLKRLKRGDRPWWKIWA